MSQILLASLLLGCAGVKPDTSSCEPDPLPACDATAPGNRFICDTCDDSYFCTSVSQEWYESDVDCACITEDGDRDTADPDCRPTE